MDNTSQKNIKKYVLFLVSIVLNLGNSYSQIQEKQIDTLSSIIKAFNESDYLFLNRFINPATGLLVVDYDYIYPIPRLIKNFKKIHFTNQTQKMGYNREFVNVDFKSYQSNVELSTYAEYLGDGEFEKKGSFIQPSKNKDFFEYQVHISFKETDKPKVKQINMETNYLLKVMPVDVDEKFLYLHLSIRKNRIYITALELIEEMTDKDYYSKSLKGFYVDISNGGVQDLILNKSVRVGKNCEDCIIDFKKKIITNSYWNITKYEPFNYTVIRLGEVENVSNRIKKRIIQFVNDKSEYINVILTNKGQLIYKGAGWQTPTVIYE